MAVVACGGGTVDVKPSTAPTADVLPEGFDVQGHRGARGLQPENTLPGFETALDLGVTTLELDLHFTADNQVVVWHDPSVDDNKCGLSGGVDAPDPDSRIVTPFDLEVRRLTAEQLAGYRCDRNPGGFPEQQAVPTLLAGDDYRIVTLGEVFDFVDAYAASEAKTAVQRAVAADVRFNIETKRSESDPGRIDDGFDGINPGPFEQETLAIIAAHGMEDRVVIQSFDHRSIWAIHRTAPAIPLAALTNRDRPDLELYAENGASIWSPRQSELTAELVAEAHGLGLEVIPWTVNEPAVMLRLIEMGVDGLISDRPDLVLALSPP